MAVVGITGCFSASANLGGLQSDAEKAGAGIGMVVRLGLIGALWFFPMVGAVVLGFILRKNSVVERGPTGPLAKASVEEVSASA